MHKTFVVALAITAGLAVAALSGCARPASAGPRAETQAALDIRKTLDASSAESGAAPAAEPVAAESSASGWATLRGTFKFDGTPPAPRKLTIDKDPETCGKGNGILDNSLVVASDGGIANIVVYAKAKRVHESAQPLGEANTAEPIVFDQKQCTFLTHVLACQVHQKIDVKNSDPIGHNTKIDPAKGVPFNQNLPSQQTVAYAPTDEEALPATVSCSIHPWMRGYLLPRKDKYFAVTRPDGSFEIPNLPAGEEVEVQVWHERANGPGGALVLVNKDLKWSAKGRFKIKLDADQTKTLDLNVPETAFK
jgi:hypothetical protein